MAQGEGGKGRCGSNSELGVSMVGMVQGRDPAMKLPVGSQESSAAKALRFKGVRRASHAARRDGLVSPASCPQEPPPLESQS